VKPSINAAPVSAWLVALVCLLPLPIPILFSSQITGLSPGPGDVETLRSYFPESRLSSNWRGVMLTMSGGLCATEGRVPLVPGGIDLVVLYSPSAALEDFEPLLDALEEARPDFLVIQDTILFREPVFDPKELYFDARRRWRALLFGAMERWTGGRQGGPQPLSRCRPDVMPRDRWASTLEKVQPSSGPINVSRVRAAERILKRLASVAPILIVAPPYSTESESYREAVAATARGIVASARVGGEITWHAPREPVPASAFADPLHLLPRFNGPYRRWLNDEISQVMGGSAD